jgi:chloramphenicol 3-O-phosphotransferase
MGGDAQQQPVKYTPVTGRVSKALKGMPVHTCNVCVPPKVRTARSRRRGKKRGGWRESAGPGRGNRG